MAAPDGKPSRFARQTVPKHPGVYWFLKNGTTPTPPYQAIAKNREGQQLSRSGFGTIAEAEAWLAEHTTAKEKGIHIRNTSLTFQQWAEWWMEHNPDLSPGTARVYRQRLRDYVYPIIGSKKLGGANGVGKHDILAVKRAMEAPVGRSKTSKRKKDKLSVSTIKSTLAMLGAIFEGAVEEDKLAVNPAKQLTKKQRKPKGRKQRKMVIFTPQQMSDLIASARNSTRYMAVMIYTALYTGMRIGELQGLRWADVHIHGEDAEQPFIVVRGQLSREKDEETGKTCFDQRALKSKHDGFTRTIPIPRQLAQEVREWRAASKKKGEDDFVFVSELNGWQPMSDSTLRADFYRVRDAAGIDAEMCVHHMRDTYASMIIFDGTPITQVAALLGHTKEDGSPNPATTLKHYAFMFDLMSGNERVRDSLEKRAAAL